MSMLGPGGAALRRPPRGDPQGEGALDRLAREGPRGGREGAGPARGEGETAHRGSPSRPAEVPAVGAGPVGEGTEDGEVLVPGWLGSNTLVSPAVPASRVGNDGPTARRDIAGCSADRGGPLTPLGRSLPSPPLLPSRLMMFRAAGGSRCASSRARRRGVSCRSVAARTPSGERKNFPPVLPGGLAAAGIAPNHA